MVSTTVRLVTARVLGNFTNMALRCNATPNLDLSDWPEIKHIASQLQAFRQVMIIA